MTRGGGGTLPQFIRHDIMGSGTPTASQVIVTVAPSVAFMNRCGGIITTGGAENEIT